MFAHFVAKIWGKTPDRQGFIQGCVIELDVIQVTAQKGLISLT